MSQFAYSQLREGIGQEPGVATALTVIGAGIAIVAGLIGAASIFVPLANESAPQLSSLAIPGAAPFFEVDVFSGFHVQVSFPLSTVSGLLVQDEYAVSGLLCQRKFAICF